jgi:hypothetical protein
LRTPADASDAVPSKEHRTGWVYEFSDTLFLAIGSVAHA